MTISIPYDWGDVVYIKTDQEQKPRQVCQIRVMPFNCVIYVLSCGSATSEHYEFEISKEKDLVISSTN